MRTVIVVCIVVLVVGAGLAYAVGLVTVDSDHAEGKYVVSLTVNTAVLSHIGATAHEKTPAEELTEASGAITEVKTDRDEFVLSENGKSMTFQLATDAKVFINDRAGTLADLHAGDAAVVRYDRQGEQLFAQVIRGIRK